jgi:hypothetical protein
MIIFVLAEFIPFRLVPQLTKTSEGVRHWFAPPDGGSDLTAGRWMRVASDQGF